MLLNCRICSRTTSSMLLVPHVCFKGKRVNCWQVAYTGFPHVFQYLKQRTCRVQAALGRLRPGELVTHRFKLADVEHAYDVFERSAETGAIKVVIDMA